MAGSAVVIAIDAGTTGVRAFAVDETGAPCGWKYREFTQHFPQPGWVEHDADRDLGGGAGDARRPAGRARPARRRHRHHRPARDRRGLGPPHGRAPPPRHRLAGPPHRGALRRAARGAGSSTSCGARTGLVLDPYFSATKLEWLLTEGGVEADADLAFGTVDSWLLWNLTAARGGPVHATDPSNASRTLLYDIRRARVVRRSCASCSACRWRACPRCGRRAGASARPRRRAIPVSGIAGDQQAALFGQACFEPGMAKNTYGTGSFVLMNVGDDCPDPVEGLLTTVAWELADGAVVYALEGAIFVTGAAVQWLRDGLGIIDDAADIEALAASVSRHRRRVRRARVHRARQPVVGPVRAGHDRRPHPRHRARPPGPGGARVDGLPDPRRRRGDERGVGPRRRRAARRRRRVGERPAAAAPGRPAPGARAPPGGAGDHRARRRLPRRSGRGRVVVARRAGARTGSSTPSSRPRCPPSVADARHAGWRRAVERSRGWAEDGAAVLVEPDATGGRRCGPAPPAAALAGAERPALAPEHEGAVDARQRAQATSSGPRLAVSRHRVDRVPAAGHERRAATPAAGVRRSSTADVADVEARRARTTAPRSRGTAWAHEAAEQQLVDGLRRRPAPRRVSSASSRGSCTCSARAARPRRRRRRPGRSPRRAATTSSASGSSTTSSSMARPAPRSRMSMPTTSPRTAPMRLATAPERARAVGQPQPHDIGLHGEARVPAARVNASVSDLRTPA